MNKTLALSLAASLLFGIASYVKYREARAQLKVYQNGALAMIASRIEEETRDAQDPALSTLDLMDAPADLPRKTPRRSLPATFHSR